MSIRRTLMISKTPTASVVRTLRRRTDPVPVHADREEELRALFAELADEGADDELPPIIQDDGLEWDTWGEAA